MKETLKAATQLRIQQGLWKVALVAVKSKRDSQQQV
jgi:hypothetical protein